MGKLIKYELKKQMLSKIVIGVLAALCEVLFLAGVLIENGDWAALGLGLLILLSFMGLFYLSFETIVTYSNDLKTKQSYMLFLIPRNMYQVVGAKMVTTFLQILLAGAFFLAVILGDVFLIFAKNGEIREMMDMIKVFFEQISGIQIDLPKVIYVICSILVIWIEFILMAIFAITLSSTLFANKRYKGMISFGIYILFEILLGKAADMVTNDVMSAGVLELNLMAWVYIGVYVVAMAICFFGTTWLLDKKISV